MRAHSSRLSSTELRVRVMPAAGCCLAALGARWRSVRASAPPGGTCAAAARAAAGVSGHNVHTVPGGSVLRGDLLSAIVLLVCGTRRGATQLQRGRSARRGAAWVISTSGGRGLPRPRPPLHINEQRFVYSQLTPRCGSDFTHGAKNPKTHDSSFTSEW